jgi:deoxyribonuclease V
MLTPFPYIPGYLSFREAPAIFSAMEKLSLLPDLLIVDGQGIAHPRRIGIASFLGVLLGLPTIGCAKSRLVGKYEEPAPERGSWSPLIDKGETVGAVLRTRKGVKPVFVSPGHLVTLPEAIEIIMHCAVKYRLPEPQRAADSLAGKSKLIAD